MRLATSHTIAEFVLPGPLVEFERKRERHLSVELVIANSLVVRELVREGRAEFGIAATDADAAPDGVLRELPFVDDAVVVAVPEGHPWAALDAIPLEELVRTPMVMRDPSANTRRTIEAALERARPGARAAARRGRVDQRGEGDRDLRERAGAAVAAGRRRRATGWSSGRSRGSTSTAAS